MKKILMMVLLLTIANGEMFSSSKYKERKYTYERDGGKVTTVRDSERVLEDGYTHEVRFYMAGLGTTDKDFDENIIVKHKLQIGKGAPKYQNGCVVSQHRTVDGKDIKLEINKFDACKESLWFNDHTCSEFLCIETDEIGSVVFPEAFSAGNKQYFDEGARVWLTAEDLHHMYRRAIGNKNSLKRLVDTEMTLSGECEVLGVDDNTVWCKGNGLLAIKLELNVHFAEKVKFVKVGTMLQFLGLVTWALPIVLKDIQECDRSSYRDRCIGIYDEIRHTSPVYSNGFPENSLYVTVRID